MALSVALARAQALPGSLAQWSPDFPRMDRFSSRDRPISSVIQIYVFYRSTACCGTGFLQRGGKLPIGPELHRHAPVGVDCRVTSASQMARPLA